MLRISKLTDYATVILARLATEPERRFTAAQISAEPNWVLVRPTRLQANPPPDTTAVSVPLLPELADTNATTSSLAAESDTATDT